MIDEYQDFDIDKDYHVRVMYQFGVSDTDDEDFGTWDGYVDFDVEYNPFVHEFEAEDEDGNDVTVSDWVTCVSAENLVEQSDNFADESVIVLYDNVEEAVTLDFEEEDVVFELGENDIDVNSTALLNTDEDVTVEGDDEDEATIDGDVEVDSEVLVTMNDLTVTGDVHLNVAGAEETGNYERLGDVYRDEVEVKWAETEKEFRDALDEDRTEEVRLRNSITIDDQEDLTFATDTVVKLLDNDLVFSETLSTESIRVRDSDITFTGAVEGGRLSFGTTNAAIEIADERGDGVVNIEDVTLGNGTADLPWTEGTAVSSSGVRVNLQGDINALGKHADDDATRLQGEDAAFRGGGDVAGEMVLEATAEELLVKDLTFADVVEVSDEVILGDNLVFDDNIHEDSDWEGLMQGVVTFNEDIDLEEIAGTTQFEGRHATDLRGLSEADSLASFAGAGETRVTTPVSFDAVGWSSTLVMEEHLDIEGDIEAGPVVEDGGSEIEAIDDANIDGLSVVDGSVVVTDSGIELDIGDADVAYNTSIHFDVDSNNTVTFYGTLDASAVAGSISITATPTSEAIEVDGATFTEVDINNDLQLELQDDSTLDTVDFLDGDAEIHLNGNDLTVEDPYIDGSAKSWTDFNDLITQGNAGDEVTFILDGEEVEGSPFSYPFD